MDGREWTRRGCLGAISTVGTITIAGCGGLATGVGTPTPKGDPAVAIEAATQAESWRQARIETTKRLAESETIRTGTDEQRQQYLQDERSDLPEAVAQGHYVKFDDDFGVTITASTEPARVGEGLYTREAPWQNDDIDYGDDGCFVSRASVARDKLIVSFVAPVETDEDGRFVLVVQADLGVLDGDLPAPDGGFTQIVDEDGRIVVGFREDELAGIEYTIRPTLLSVLQDGLAGESGVVQGSEINEYTRGDFEEFVIGFAPVEGAEWVVFTHEPVATDDGFF